MQESPSPPVNTARDPLAPAAGLTATIAGSGPDVVLVHGSVGDYRQWDAIATRLAARRTVLSLSRRYHWPNAMPPRGVRYTYEEHRDDLLKYLRERARPAHLVGHSYGAGVVLLAALSDPSSIRSLTLIEPAFNSLLPAGAPELECEQASRAAMVADVRARAAQGDDAGATRILIDWVQGGPGGFEGLPDAVRQWMLDNAATAGPTVGFTPPEVTLEQLRELVVPTLVMTGERTRLYYRLIGERVASAVPRARYERVPDAAHMSIVERPQSVAGLIADFIPA
jgi:pimeloyl-ACP methyl ester carboxylesterase